MVELPAPEECGQLEYAHRTAACLGALGYSPHEIVCLLAGKLHVDHTIVAKALTREPRKAEATAA